MSCFSLCDITQVAGQTGHATSTYHKHEAFPVYLLSAALSTASTKAHRTLRDFGAVLSKRSRVQLADTAQIQINQLSEHNPQPHRQSDKKLGAQLMYVKKHLVATRQNEIVDLVSLDDNEATIRVSYLLTYSLHGAESFLRS
jgi:hypothetical protein